MLLAHCEDKDILIVKLGEGHIHIAEKLFLLLFPEGE